MEAELKLVTALESLPFSCLQINISRVSTSSQAAAQMARSDPHLPDLTKASFSAQRLLKIPPPIYLHADDPGSPPPGSILLDPYGYLSDQRHHRRGLHGGRSYHPGHLLGGQPAARLLLHFRLLRLLALRVRQLAQGRPLGGRPHPVPFPHRHHQPSRRRPMSPQQRGPPVLCLPGRHHDTPPSLNLVPILDDLEFSDHEAVLLRCHDQDMFYLALLVRVSDFKYDDEQYDLHLYNSKTGTWNTKLTHIDYDYSPKENFNFAYPNAVLTIGGESGSVGWVDLWRGILICHLLLPDNHILCYIPLPLPQVPKPLRGYARYSWNIMVFGDHIKFFEMVRPSSDTGRICDAEDLVAATKKMKISDIGSRNVWEEECAVNISEIPVDSLEFAQMLPSLKHVTDTKDKALVIAVDMKNKTIKDVAYFGSGRYLGYNHTYLQSGISKYLDIWSSSRTNMISIKHTKEPNNSCSWLISQFYIPFLSCPIAILDYCQKCENVHQ
ncbi:unnamed protein product [Miscanthus lutarioriparius]|uniref:DUF1618 domain-containing protein n=1 Tax=Miscanthus lutarioriparius TaxID=422564 RepID=A0A811SNG0_9POAL|nr:unnamed protein product [Miscanthus lutarioriparius]